MTAAMTALQEERNSLKEKLAVAEKYWYQFLEMQSADGDLVAPNKTHFYKAFRLGQESKK